MIRKLLDDFHAWRWSRWHWWHIPQRRLARKWRKGPGSRSL